MHGPSSATLRRKRRLFILSVQIVPFTYPLLTCFVILPYITIYIIVVHHAGKYRFLLAGQDSRGRPEVLKIKQTPFLSCRNMSGKLKMWRQTRRTTRCVGILCLIASLFWLTRILPGGGNQHSSGGDGHAADTSDIGKFPLHKKLNNTMDQLWKAALATGYRHCQGTPVLPHNQMENALLNNSSDLAVTVDVPCRAKRTESNRLPCCERTVHLRYNTTDYAVYRSVFMQHGFYYLYGLFDAAPPKYILDAGANAGFTTLLFKLMYPEAVIVSVEPNADNFKQLQKNIQGLQNVHALNAGLWGWTADIKPKIKAGEWGYVFQEANSSDSSTTKAYSVPDVMKMYGIESFDLLKIDVEGAEGKIFHFKADTSWVRKAKMVCMEVHESFAPHFELTALELTSGVTTAMAGFISRRNGEHDLYFAPSLFVA